MTTNNEPNNSIPDLLKDIFGSAVTIPKPKTAEEVKKEDTINKLKSIFGKDFSTIVQNHNQKQCQDKPNK